VRVGVVADRTVISPLLTVDLRLLVRTVAVGVVISLSGGLLGISSLRPDIVLVT
jgi:hypothetical protein